jgi:hypothetical protein
VGPHLPFALNMDFWDFFLVSGQHTHPQLLKFCLKVCLDLRIITKIRNEILDIIFWSNRHEVSDVPIEPSKKSPAALLHRASQVKPPDSRNVKKSVTISYFPGKKL